MRLFWFIVTACATVVCASPEKPYLSPQEHALVLIACYEAKGDLGSLNQAIHRGFDDGLTINQIKEVLTHLYAYTGFPRALNALGVLQQVIAEREKLGKVTPLGRDSTPLARDFDALKAGTAVQTQLCGGKPFSYTFAPALDYYLKAHLFGDIFARDVLSHAERELVTIAALSGMEGTQPQLKAHMAGALNMGLSQAKIDAVTQTLHAKGLIPNLHGGDSPWPRGTFNRTYAKYFVGKSYLAPLGANHGEPINVTFEPRCRNNWHIHHGHVQVLITVTGRGWYVEEGREPVELKPGVVITVPAGKKHWHGAAKDSWLQHLTYHTQVEVGSSTEWLYPVLDDEYNNLR